MTSIIQPPPCSLNSLTSNYSLFFFVIADLHACTAGENQTPTHYAAKNDAAKALKVLLKLGGRMEDRDYKQRTPLQVAAELGMVIYWIKTEKFLNVCVILLNCSCHSTYNYLSIFDCFIIYPEVLIRTKLAAGGIPRASAFVCFW